MASPKVLGSTGCSGESVAVGSIGSLKANVSLPGAVALTAVDRRQGGMPCRMNALGYLRGIGSMRGPRTVGTIGIRLQAGGSPRAAVIERQSDWLSSLPPHSGRLHWSQGGRAIFGKAESWVHCLCSAGCDAGRTRRPSWGSLRRAMGHLWSEAVPHTGSEVRRAGSGVPSPPIRAWESQERAVRGL